VVAGSENGERVLLVGGEDAFFAVLDFGEFLFESTELLLVVVFDKVAFLSFLEVHFHLSFLSMLCLLNQVLLFFFLLTNVW
jgi:hypothetical protein